ncbi:MAG: hypothetical protein IT373_34395 [Polyangiaceae bacterium]|nr:hypothetical protein [Polyangiaceae bacterium]
MTAETRPDGAVTTMAYDAGGNLLSLTPPAQPAHALVYAASDMLVSYAPPGADAVQYSYDVDRKLTTVTVATTPTTNYAYDSGGRLASMTDAFGTVTQTYDPVTGELASLAGPGNVTLSFGYDGALPTDRVYTGDVTGTVRFQHDDEFRVTQQSVGADTVTLGYDADGLLAQAGDQAIARDAASGLPTGTTLGVVTDAYGYNGHGEIVAYAASAAGVSLLDLSYVRDALGRVVEKTESVEGGAPTVEAYEYDLAGRLVRVTRDGGLAAEYAYDPNGNRLSATEYAVPGDLGSAVETLGTYDPADALLAFGGARYDHDALGARAHRYGPEAGEVTSYAYDPSGSLRSVVHTREFVVPCGGGGAGGAPGSGGAGGAPAAGGAGGDPGSGGAGGAPGTGGGPVGFGGGPMGFGGGIVGFGGGPEHMGGGPGVIGVGGGPESMGGGPLGLGTGGALAATGGTGGTPGGGAATCTTTETTTIEYVVDGERHRVLKKWNGVVVRGYLWQSDLRIAAELDAAGAVVSRYVYGERTNVPEYMVRADGTYRIVTDHLGSPRLVVDVATGAVVARMSYEAWGNLLPGSDVGVVPFGFAGGVCDAETGLVRFGARDYDPGVGRWTAKERRPSAQRPNLYEYSDGDPVNGHDPDGTQPRPCVYVPPVPACRDPGPGEPGCRRRCLYREMECVGAGHTDKDCASVRQGCEEECIFHPTDCDPVPHSPCDPPVPPVPQPRPVRCSVGLTGGVGGSPLALLVLAAGAIVSGLRRRRNAAGLVAILTAAPACAFQAQEVLCYVEWKYSALEEYHDRGRSASLVQGEHLGLLDARHFETRFRRDGGFFFTSSDGGDHVVTLRGDESSVAVHFQHGEEERLGLAQGAAEARGITFGTSEHIPGLLMPGSLRSSLLYFDAVDGVDEEFLDGKKCVVISGQAGTRHKRLWIDRARWLVVRLEERYRRNANDIRVTTTTFLPIVAKLPRDGGTME